jgi:universal stress protein A
MKLERILVPVDFSDHSRKALDCAADLAEKFGSALEVVYVWSPPHYFSPDIMLAAPGWSATSLEQYARTEAVKDMEKFMGSFSRQGLRSKTRIEVGRPAAAIVRVATEEKADLIVMGTHGLTGLSRVLLGSVAQEVVAKSLCPVMTMKGP